MSPAGTLGAILTEVLRELLSPKPGWFPHLLNVDLTTLHLNGHLEVRVRKSSPRGPTEETPAAAVHQSDAKCDQY